MPEIKSIHSYLKSTLDDSSKVVYGHYASVLNLMAYSIYGTLLHCVQYNKGFKYIFLRKDTDENVS
jgi:hypothetical protein